MNFLKKDVNAVKKDTETVFFDSLPVLDVCLQIKTSDGPVVFGFCQLHIMMKNCQITDGFNYLLFGMCF